MLPMAPATEATLPPRSSSHPLTTSGSMQLANLQKRPQPPMASLR